MNKKVNGSGGDWFSFEQLLKSKLDGGANVKVNMKLNYSGNSKRPDSIEVNYTVDGIPQSPKTIQNTK